MFERLKDIKGALEEADNAIFYSQGMYGREEGCAWISAALMELEALRGTAGICLISEAQAHNYCDAGLRDEQREAARWPAQREAK